MEQPSDSLKSSYVQEVLDHLQYGEIRPGMEPFLATPNTANLRNAVTSLLKFHSPSKDDLVIINGFLNFRKDSFRNYHGDELIRAVENYTKFKRVTVFLKRYSETTVPTTDLINIELLAVLGGYKPRPFHRYRTTARLEDEGVLKTDPKKLSEKEAVLLEHILMNERLMHALRDEMLKEIGVHYDLSHNPHFLRLEAEVHTNAKALDSFLVYLEDKIESLKSQLGISGWTRRYLGPLGLFLIDTPNPDPTLESTLTELVVHFFDPEIAGLDDDHDHDTEDLSNMW